MNEKEAMEYIAYLNTLGSKPGLTVIRELLRRAGDPQKELAFIHIAGTNGKGSVSAFLSNILMAAGYRVGRYNSPTIRTYRERICVNKSMISKTALCRLLTQLKTCCDEMVAETNRVFYVGMTRPSDVLILNIEVLKKGDKLLQWPT